MGAGVGGEESQPQDVRNTELGGLFRVDSRPEKRPSLSMVETSSLGGSVHNEVFHLSNHAGASAACDPECVLLFWLLFVPAT